MKLATLALLMSATAAQAFPVTVQSCDRKVTFDAPPTRAISNDVNLTEMMLVLGLRDSMIGYTGISGWKTLDEGMREGVAKLPELSAKYPTREVLVGAEPDFFFAGWNYGMRVGGEVTPETLAPFGIAVYELTESCIHLGAKAQVTMQDMYDDLLNLGRIFGVEDRATALVAGYEARLAEVAAGVDRSDPLRVFVYDSGEESLYTAGRYAMPTALIELAGGVNIMDDLDRSWAGIAWEPVVERNPQVIVIVNYGDVTAEQKIAFMKGNPAFAGIDAVVNDRFVVPDYVEATPGPRNIQVVEKLVAGFADWPGRPARVSRGPFLRGYHDRKHPYHDHSAPSAPWGRDGDRPQRAGGLDPARGGRRGDFGAFADCGGRPGQQVGAGAD